MKIILILLQALLFVACNTNNPNTQPVATPSHPKGANRLVDSIDKEPGSYTDSVDFKNAKKESPELKQKPD